jgi:carboxymethylenebutenolidase
MTRPLMMHIAEEDGFVSKEAQATIKAALNGQRLVEIHSYPGLDHAFARRGGQHYDDAGANFAGQRTLDFFRKNLG